MFDKQYRCIFIHQRKAAGSSIITAFGKPPKVGPWRLFRNPEWHRYNDGVLSKGWDRRPDWFVFAVVRNPFDRAVSGWRYLRHTRDLTLRQALLEPPPGQFIHYHLTQPQIVFLRDKTGQLVTDDLIRFESLQEDFDRICDKLGRPRSALPHIRRGRHRETGYRDYFDADTRRIAEELFRDDLETFGYDF